MVTLSERAAQKVRELLEAEGDQPVDEVRTGPRRLGRRLVAHWLCMN